MVSSFKGFFEYIFVLVLVEKDSNLTTIKWIETAKLDNFYEKTVFFAPKFGECQVC